MTPPAVTPRTAPWNRGRLWFAALSLLTVLVYWPGIYGTYIFDDYANIVENRELHIDSLDLSEVKRAALSSPSSEFKRPLASLSFAMNHLATGLAPMPMKLTNLAIHLMNGLLLFILGIALLRRMPSGQANAERIAAVIAAAWMLLPINLSAVLYVVQRMESLAHLFVLLGLLGYLHGRVRMADHPLRGLLISTVSLVTMTGLGLLAKESAVLLPLYALLMEWVVLGGLRRDSGVRKPLLALYGLLLGVPLIAGLLWIAPGIFNPNTWMRRDFTLYERLLTEGRVVLGYIGWTIVPLPQWLSFYHDDYVVSRGWLSPWTTLPALALLLGLLVTAWTLRRQKPVFSLGIAWYFGAHTLTATVLPLELVFEHRNYFASYGLLLALSSLLLGADAPATARSDSRGRKIDMTIVGRIAGALLLALWTAFTAMTASIWGNPLRLGLELEARAPDSSRARYEVAKTYLTYSGYDPSSPFATLAYRAFESAMQQSPSGSILPEQALIMMASRMDQPIKDEWWQSIQRKLAANPPSVEDDGAIMALTRCTTSARCDLSVDKLSDMYATALRHPHPSPRLVAAYGDFAWNILDDRPLGERMAREAVRMNPSVAVYRITLIKMLLVQGIQDQAQSEIDALSKLPGWSNPAVIMEALGISSGPVTD